MKVNWPYAFRSAISCFNLTWQSMPWWFCFGTMLSIVRIDIARAMGKKDAGFPKRDDIDVGVFFNDFQMRYIENFCQANGYEIGNKIVTDTDRKPLHVTFHPLKDNRDAIGDFNVDIFCWVKHDGHYWHTFDTQMETPKKGIPSKYIFKGVPCWMFDNGFVERENVGGSMHSGKIPLKYGSLLDLWYPNWLVPKECISEAPKMIETKSCKTLGL